MTILNIEPASRTGMRFLISLYGLSETGKTFSALRLAAGMEPDPKKRMLLDTEGGQRGRAYVDLIPGGYLYASLSAPFTPERYIEALREIEAAGVNVLVIDSISHAWFAEGGILDIVDASTTKNDMAKWKEPKRRLSKMTGRILHSDMHIILCSRAKQPLIEEPDPGRPGKSRMVPGPVMPVQEKSLRYDMTVMGLMLGDGRFTVTAPAGKCPGPLREVFASGEVMTEEMGRRLIAWLGGADLRTPEQRQLEARAEEAAEAGSDAFRAFWKELTPAQRDLLKRKMDSYSSAARAADAERERQAREKAEDLEDPFSETRAQAGRQPDPAAADVAFEEAAAAARQGMDALRKWWDGDAGKAPALGTDRSMKSLISHRWRELERIASTPAEEAA